MPSPRWRKTLRDLLMHKGRTLLVVAAIAVGLAGAGTILDAWALIRVATREGFLASDPAAATLRVDSVDAALLARVKALPGVRDAQARRSTVARAQVAGATLTARLFTFEDFKTIRIGQVKPESGAWPPADGELIVERSSLDFAGASVGEELLLSVGDASPVATRVAGIARDVGLAPGWMEHLLYGFVSRGTLERLGVPSTLNELQIVVRDGTPDQEEVRKLAFEVKAAVEAAGHRVFDVDVPVPGEHIHAPQMDSLLYTQGAFALMALMLSAFLVVNLVAAMLTGQTREIGVMKAIGARWQQIAAMYLSVAALLGVVAVALAVPVALVVGRRYAALKADLLNFDITGYEVPALVIGAQVIAGVLIPVLAALVPVWHGCRVPVNDALRDVGIAGGGGTSAFLQRIGGLSRPILLSLRNTFRRRQRMMLTLLALATGGAVFLGALNLRASVLGATDLLYSAQRFDFVLRLAEPQPPEMLEALVRTVAGVEDGEAWSGARATVDHGDGTLGNAFAVTAPPAGTKMLGLTLEEGRWLTSNDTRALVINRGLLREEPALRVGVTTRLLIAGDPTDWTIVGIVDSGPAPLAYAPREAIATLVAGGGSTGIVVRSAYDSQASQVDLIQRLRGELEGRGIAVASSTLLAESRRAVEDHLLMVVQFLGSMAWLMIFVGGLGLASTMGLAVLERTREIGVLRAIGARHLAIFTLVQVEGLTIALLCWALAIPLSVPMSVLLGQAFGRIMLRVPTSYLPDATGVAIWFGLVVVVAVFACAWPARRAMRVPTAAALAYE